MDRTRAGTRIIFDVADGGFTACFDQDVGAQLLADIAHRGPLRAAFRASASQTDALRLNTEQLFQQINPLTTLATV